MTQSRTPPNEVAETRLLARQLYRLAGRFEQLGDQQHAAEARRLARAAAALASRREGPADG